MGVVFGGSGNFFLIVFLIVFDVELIRLFSWYDVLIIKVWNFVGDNFIKWVGMIF